MKHGQFLLFDGKRRKHGVKYVAEPLDDTVKEIPLWMSDRSQRFSVQWRALDPSFNPKITAAGLCARLFDCRTKPLQEISKKIQCEFIKTTKKDIIQSIMSRIQIHEQSRDVVKQLVIQELWYDKPAITKRNQRLKKENMPHHLFWVHPGCIQQEKMKDLRTSLTTGIYKGIRIHS